MDFVIQSSRMLYPMALTTAFNWACEPMSLMGIRLVILYVSLLSSFYSLALPGVIIGADVLSKLCTAVMINTLPYARTEEESKVKVLYRKIRLCELVLVALLCLTALWLMSTPFLALIPTLLIINGLRWYFKRKIGGYTGDCCGALFLLSDMSFWLGAVMSIYIK